MKPTRNVYTFLKYLDACEREATKFKHKSPERAWRQSPGGLHRWVYNRVINRSSTTLPYWYKNETSPKNAKRFVFEQYKRYKKVGYVPRLHR